jgi:VIT1/CCC1 family predicted Fe2+/Mn2+ transporter
VLEPTEWLNFATKYEKQSDHSLLAGGDVKPGAVTHVWVDTMLTEEHGLPLEMPAPLRAAGTTFLAFLAAGSVPLLPLGFFQRESAFAASALLSAVVFLGIGLVKARIAREPLARSAAETLLVGGGAALLAYAVGLATTGLVP